MTIREIDVSDNRPLLVKAAEYKNTKNDYMPPETLGKPRSNSKNYKSCLAMDSCIKNVLSGFNDELAYMAMPKFIGYPMLANVSQEALIRAGVETIADEMTRRLVEFTYDDDDGKESEKKEKLISKMQSEFARFKIKDILNDALVKDGNFGGCLIYIDVGDLDDDEAAEPLVLKPQTFKKGSLRGFKVIEPINIYPGRYNTNDPTNANYFKPEYWYILGRRYHASRFIYIASNEAPLLLKPAYNFFGIPRAQLALDYVAQFVANRESAQELLNKFSLTCWKTNMTQVLQGQSTSDLVKRAKLFNKMKHNSGVMLIDKETEDMIQINTPLGGVRDIVEMSLNLLTAVWRIPKIKYIGEGEGGLNASSKEQMRSFYDFILSQKEKVLTQPMETFLKLIQLNLGLEINDSLGFKFPAMVEMDEADRANLNKMQADRDNIYLTSGVLSQEEVRQRLSMDKNSGYSMIDIDDVPEMPEQPLKDGEESDKNEKGKPTNDMAMDDKWITVGHRDADGDDEGRKGRHILLKNGEEPVEAIERTVGKDIDGDGKVGKKDSDKGESDKDSQKETEKKPDVEPSKEKKPEEKSEKEDKDKDDGEEDLSKFSDEEIKGKADKEFSDAKQLRSEEDSFVENNEKIKQLNSEIRKMEIESWNMLDEKEREQKGKERDEKIDDKVHLDFKLRQEFRKEHGDWTEFVLRGNRYQKEKRLRDEAKEEKVGKKIDGLFESLNENNIDDKLNEIAEARKEIGSLEVGGQIRKNKEFTQKVEKKAVNLLSEKISGKVKDYGKKTDGFVKDIASVDDEYNRANEKNKEIKKKVDDAYEKYSKERDTENGEQLRKEWRQLLEQQYAALDNVMNARKKRVEVVANKLRETFGDTGNKIETNAGKKGSFSHGVYQKLSSYLDGVIGKNISTQNPPKVSAGANRAFYSKGKGIKLNKESSSGTMIHEFCHFLEENNPKMLIKSKAFLEYRTKGEEAQTLNKLEGAVLYGNGEVAKKDKFFSSYCGKIYGADKTGYYSADATELMSMGVQKLFEDPVSFAKEDREYFDFVIGNLRGEI